jgi:hypothetical protein
MLLPEGPNHHPRVLAKAFQWKVVTICSGQVEQDQEILYRGGQGVGLSKLAAL